MKKLLAFCCCISAVATAAVAQPAQPSEYQLKLTPAEAAELGRGLADKIKDAQALLGLVGKLQQQLDAQNKPAIAAPPVPTEEPKQ